MMWLLLQGNKQVTRAAIEWYGPDRAKWLGAHPHFVLPVQITLAPALLTCIPAACLPRWLSLSQWRVAAVLECTSALFF